LETAIGIPPPHIVLEVKYSLSARNTDHKSGNVNTTAAAATTTKTTTTTTTIIIIIIIIIIIKK
jgi:hypothetical protein